MKIFVSFSFDGRVPWYLRSPTRFDHDLLKVDNVTEGLSRSVEPSVHNLVKAADVVVGVMRFGQLGLGKTAFRYLIRYNRRGICLVDRWQVNWWTVCLRRLIDWPWCSYIFYSFEEEAIKKLGLLLEKMAAGSFVRRLIRKPAGSV